MTQPQIANAEDGASVRGKLNKILRGEFQVVVEYLGSELVTDGDLATDPALSGWTMNDAVWSAGQIVAEYDSNSPAFSFPVTTEMGAVYLLEFTQTALANDNTAVYFANGQPRMLAGRIGLNAVLFDGAVDGEETIRIDFDQYKTGAAHTITSVSVRKVAEPDEPFTVLDAAGTQHFSIGMYNGDVSVGRSAGANQGDGSYNNVNLGPFAGYSITAGYDNINIGGSAGFSLTENANNVNIGAYAGFSGNGSQNVNIGQTAGYTATASGNTNIGSRAGVGISSGANNTNIGADSGTVAGTGARNICIGHGAELDDSNANDQINIGDVFKANGDRASISKPLVLTGGTPASASDTGAAGTVLWDASFIYICVDTDTWKRVAIATW